MDLNELSPDDVIYDWNRAGAKAGTPAPVLLFDESLRDGIQSPSVVDPPIDAKIRFLHLLDSLGVQYSDIGLPGAGPRAFNDVVRLAREIDEAGLKIRPACAARTVEADIRPIVEASQKTGMAIEVMTFIGSSPIRALAEDWDEDLLARRSAAAVDFAVKAGLPVTYVTEDTVRSRPSTLEKLFKAAIDHGAQGLCLCDTVGHATEEGVRALVGFTRELIDTLGTKTRIDWHGHNDRGLALSNALIALEAGADRIHGTILGIGERVGNTSLDLLLVNLKLMGRWEPDLSHMLELCRLTSESCEVPISINYPVVGRDAFRTGTGVHAAAVIKAARKGQTWLADRIYSGVPAGMFGLEQEIEIGHMSGLSNVTWWLERHRVAPREGLAEAILSRAKATNRLLTTDEILEVVQQYP
jgi:2-isopropylmalate synthase